MATAISIGKLLDLGVKAGQFRLKVYFHSEEHLNAALERHADNLDHFSPDLWRTNGNKLYLDRFYYFKDIFGSDYYEYMVQYFYVEDDTLIVKIEQ